MTLDQIWSLLANKPKVHISRLADLLTQQEWWYRDLRPCLLLVVIVVLFLSDSELCCKHYWHFCADCFPYILGWCDFISQNKHNQISQTKIRVTSTLLFILAGCILFVTIPAVIFKHIEGWTALESTYFVVITLTTVGIGDYVAGRGRSNPYIPSTTRNYVRMHFKTCVNWTGPEGWHDFWTSKDGFWPCIVFLLTAPFLFYVWAHDFKAKDLNFCYRELQPLFANFATSASL